MSTQLQTIPPQPLTVVERATLVFAAVKSEAELQELAKASATIVTITNQAGYEQCHAARMVLKNTRLEIARTGEEGREDAVKVSKAVIARQKALIALTQPEEDRLATIQEAWDDKIKAEEEAKVQAEVNRVAEIQRRIDGIRNWPVNAAAQPSMLVGQMLAQAQAFRVEAEVFQEHCETAAAALVTSVAALTGILEAAKKREAEQEQLRRDQEELAQRRRDDAERERIAAAERSKQEAADRAAREAEAARVRKEREENERVNRQRQADLDRQAEEQRKANAAEEKRLADQRAEIERQQEALREAQRPKPEPAPVPVRTLAAPRAASPGREAIIKVIAAFYDVHPDIARYWLSAIRWKDEEAA